MIPHDARRIRAASRARGALLDCLATPAAWPTAPVHPTPDLGSLLLAGRSRRCRRWHAPPARLVALGGPPVMTGHPANPVPRRRTVAFLAALLALGFALLSGIGATTRPCSRCHMVQHVLLVLVAAPLLALAAPITLVLRLLVAPARSLDPARPPFARSLRVLDLPVTAWVSSPG
jgi:hypothetical protein